MIFCKMSPVHSADTLQVQNFSHRFQDKCAFAIYAEIQDGCQKWQESNFCEKSPVDSADTLLFQNFVEIALSRTVSEINALLHFTQKFKMAAKSGRKVIFVKSCQYTLETLGVENFYEIPLSWTVKEIEANLCFFIFKMAVIFRERKIF